VSDSQKDPDDSEVRVIDRRWWARRASSDAADLPDDAPARKPTVVEDLEQRLAESGEQVQAVLSEYRRASEEFEQAKVRIRRDVAREVERGRRTVLAELLEVLDNLDRAIAAARGPRSAEGGDSLLRGVELVRDQFLAKLESFGVSRIDALGTPFDPQIHEAMSLAPVADASQAGLVVAVVREGYAMGADLLRPAGVIVGSHG
jgi:molecular chaperone GrpE